MNYSEIFFEGPHNNMQLYKDLLHHPSSGNREINTFSLCETSS